jgi:hypothetical protein
LARRAHLLGEQGRGNAWQAAQTLATETWHSGRCKHLISVDEGHVPVPLPKPRQARFVRVELRILPTCMAHGRNGRV